MEVVTGFLDWLTTTSFMPHGQCVRWDPLLLATQITGDFLTWTSFVLTPIALVRFIRRNPQGMLLGAPHATALYFWLATLYVFCGTTHALGIITVWFGIYHIDAVMRLLTGIVGWITLDHLWRVDIEQQALWSNLAHMQRMRMAITLAEEGLKKLENAVRAESHATP